VHTQSGCYTDAGLCCCRCRAALLWVLSHNAQEVGHNALAILRDDALRVELHALDVGVPAGSIASGASSALCELVTALPCDDALGVETNDVLFV
jgi:hypothetical protein